MSVSFTTLSAEQKNHSLKRKILFYALGLSLLIYAAVAIYFALLKIYANEDDNKAILTPVQREQVAEVETEVPQQQSSADASLGGPPPAAPPIFQLEIPSEVSLAQVEPTVIDFNSNNYRTSGMGMGGQGLGLGSGLGLRGRGGGASFFGQRQTGQRFLYVIDLSGSIRASMQEIIVSQLSTSLRNFNGSKYQVVCFNQSAWFMGEEKRQKGRGKKREEDEAKISKASWLGREDLWNSLKQIENLPWGGGTNWQAALNTALAIDPKPDVIYFMTDGVDKREDFAEKYGKLMKDNRIQLVCIGLVNKPAAEAMEGLAKEARGKVVWAKEEGGNQILHDFTR